MPVESPQLRIDPYTSTVPLVQLPPELLQQKQPAPRDYMGKAGGIAQMANATFKGILTELQQKEQKKYATAIATTEGLDRNTNAAWETYQQALATGKATNKPDDPLYAAYLQSFNQAKAAKAQFAIPDKGTKKPKTDKKKESSSQAGLPSGMTTPGGAGGGGFGAGLKQFFERNPHIIPEITLLAMQPKPPGASVDTTLQQQQIQQGENTLTEQKGNIEAQKEQLKITAYNFQRGQTDDQRKDSERKVLEMGGPDAVLQKAAQKDPSITPDLVAAANVLNNTTDPTVTQKRQVWSQVQDYQKRKAADPKATMDPETRIMAGQMGFMPAIQTPTVFKGGHNVQQFIDPSTGKPLLDAKGKPMEVDLGTPKELAFHYQERAEKRQDLFNAINGNPEAFGIPSALDDAAKKARVNQMVDLMSVAQDNRLIFAAMSRGLSPYEASRENAVVSGLLGEVGKELKNKPSINVAGIGDAKPEEVIKGLQQFFVPPTEGDGNASVRTTPMVPDGQDPAVTEAWRKFAYNHYVNQLVNQKGLKGKPYTREEAEKIADSTALGQPVSATKSESAPSRTDKPETESKPSSVIVRPNFLGFPGSHYIGKTPENVGGNFSGRPDQVLASSVGGLQVWGQPGPGKKFYAVMYKGAPTPYATWLTDEEMKNANQDPDGMRVEEIPQ